MLNIIKQLMTQVSKQILIDIFTISLAILIMIMTALIGYGIGYKIESVMVGFVLGLIAIIIMKMRQERS